MGSCLGVGFVQPFLTAITSGTHTREVNRGTGYDPLKPQRGWRSAWRSLRIETAERAAQGIEDEAARKKAMAPFIGLRFHDLRHTAITKLAESEASDQTIMSIAGHLDRKMLEHYSHIRNAAKRKAVDAIKSYIPGEHTLHADNSATVQ